MVVTLTVVDDTSTSATTVLIKPVAAKQNGDKLFALSFAEVSRYTEGKK
jgi:hypothetical protein